MSVKERITAAIRKITKLKLIAAMLVCILIIECVIGAVMPHLENNGLFGEKLNSIGKLEGTYNRVILGDSRSHQGLNPKVLDEGSDYHTFNLAVPGMQTPFFYYVLRRWIKEKGAPDQVVVNISFYLLGGRQWMDDIYYAYYTPTVEEAYDSYMNMLNYKAKDAVAWYFRTRIPSLRYNKRLRDVFKTFNSSYETHRTLSDLRNKRIRTLNEGYQGYYARGTDRIEDSIKLSTYTTTIHNGYSVYQKYLKRFFELSKEYDLDIYVYDFPWPQQYETSDNFNEVHDFYADMIAEIAAPYPRVHIISNDYFYPHEYFVDNLHLNDNGATVLSADIGKLINGT